MGQRTDTGTDLSDAEAMRALTRGGIGRHAIVEHVLRESAIAFGGDHRNGARIRHVLGIVYTVGGKLADAEMLSCDKVEDRGAYFVVHWQGRDPSPRMARVVAEACVRVAGAPDSVLGWFRVRETPESPCRVLLFEDAIAIATAPDGDVEGGDATAGDTGPVDASGDPAPDAVEAMGDGAPEGAGEGGAPAVSEPAVPDGGPAPSGSSSGRPDRRPLPGVPGYEIDRGCNVFEAGAEEPIEIEAWPYVEVSVGGEAVAVNVAEATAVVWLSPRNCAELHRIGEEDRPTKDGLAPLALKLGISVWALLEAARRPVEDFRYSKLLAALGEGRVDDSARLHAVEDAAFDEYPTPLLAENYRSPSKGGNSRALHSHMIVVGGRKYTWKALGVKKWAYVGDRVSFRYVVGEDGKRTLLKRSFRAVGKDGKEVVRGDRGTKGTLRSTNQKVGSLKMQRE